MDTGVQLNAMSVWCALACQPSAHCSIVSSRLHSATAFKETPSGQCLDPPAPVPAWTGKSLPRSKEATNLTLCHWLIWKTPAGSISHANEALWCRFFLSSFLWPLYFTRYPLYFHSFTLFLMFSSPYLIRPPHSHRVTLALHFWRRFTSSNFFNFGVFMV